MEKCRVKLSGIFCSSLIISVAILCRACVLAKSFKSL